MRRCIMKSRVLDKKTVDVRRGNGYDSPVLLLATRREREDRGGGEAAMLPLEAHSDVRLFLLPGAAPAGARAC